MAKSSTPKQNFSHVYVLVHRTEARFKIGKADDVLRRASDFGVADFDSAKSLSLKVASSVEAVRLERLLHKMFSAWQLTPSEARDSGARLDGSTEWFKIDCFDRLRTFLDGNRDLLNFEEVPVRLTEPLLPRRVTQSKRSVRTLERLIQVEGVHMLWPHDLRLWSRLVSISRADGSGFLLVAGSSSEILQSLGIADNRHEEQALQACLERLSKVQITGTDRGKLVLSCGIVPFEEWKHSPRDGRIKSWEVLLNGHAMLLMQPDDLDRLGLVLNEDARSRIGQQKTLNIGYLGNESFRLLIVGEDVCHWPPR